MTASARAPRLNYSLAWCDSAMRPAIVGMDRNRFNREVRPFITRIPIGRQGLAFDRLELDAWVEDYKSRNGRPAAERRKPWDVEKQPGLVNRGGVWHIDKNNPRSPPLRKHWRKQARKSGGIFRQKNRRDTQGADLRRATESALFDKRPTKYLNENQHKKRIDR